MLEQCELGKIDFQMRHFHISANKQKVQMQSLAFLDFSKEIKNSLFPKPRKKIAKKQNNSFSVWQLRISSINPSRVCLVGAVHLESYPPCWPRTMLFASCSWGFFSLRQPWEF